MSSTEKILESALGALWAIAHMEITENTDTNKMLMICVSMARLELGNYSARLKLAELVKC